MKCVRATIQYVDGKPASYSLILSGTEKAEVHRGATLKEVPFKEAFETFAAVRKHWNPDGTAKR